MAQPKNKSLIVLRDLLIAQVCMIGGKICNGIDWSWWLICTPALIIALFMVRQALVFWFKKEV